MKINIYGYLKKRGNVLGREGMSALVRDCVEEWVKSGKTDKGAIYLAGRLHAISLMARSDDYWNEKNRDGFYREVNNQKKQRIFEMSD